MASPEASKIDGEEKKYEEDGADHQWNDAEGCTGHVDLLGFFAMEERVVPFDRFLRVVTLWVG